MHRQENSFDGWQATERYDLIIIGGSPAGLAAGDVRHNSFRQVITAAGDGAAAAMSAFKYVKE
jgi:thioredoxin reductase (NADPH)